MATNGINRPEEGKRTAPSAVNAQDINIFVFNDTGVYLYNAQNHRLQLVVKGDNRKIFSSTETETLPSLLLLLVSDISRFRIGEETVKLEWAAISTVLLRKIYYYFAHPSTWLVDPEHL